MKQLKIAPSLLAADFSRLASEIEKVEKAGADLLHVDVMDGHFVPNLTIGPIIVKAIRALSTLPLDVHLMMMDAEKYLENFAKAGSNMLTIHVEATKGKTATLLSRIKEMGLRAGLALNPGTPLSAAKEFFSKTDMILLMTVHPGFGGQKFIPDVLQKVEELRKTYAGDIEVDGGIDPQTGKLAVAKGANVLVAGTYIFRSEDPKEAIQALRQCQ
ncbi:MAG: ribulose-phosphate 3-epimerase [Candidatus Omnitrophica bacterium]|nr:ribulose-phosphate 3-epimerase [Candidatus Omnitrophota bacterium]